MSHSIERAIERAFISPNVADSNMEPANLVDVVHHAAHSLGHIAKAILPPDAALGEDSYGYVASLTEAVMGVTAGLSDIAGAIRELANAVSESKC